MLCWLLGAGTAYLSTKVMLSAISATRLAILVAMIEYADPLPSAPFPATEAALFCTGAARLAGALAAGFFAAAALAAGFFGRPFVCVAVLGGIAAVSGGFVVSRVCRVCFFRFRRYARNYVDSAIAGLN